MNKIYKKTKTGKHIPVEINQRISHGMSKTDTYQVYSNMRSRCTNPKHPQYPSYGGRGIRAEWDTFEAFYEDMGDKPFDCSLDRRDNDGDYNKDNCRWAVQGVQMYNTRRSKSKDLTVIKIPSCYDVVMDKSERPYTAKELAYLRKEKHSLVRVYQK